MRKFTFRLESLLKYTLIEKKMLKGNCYLDRKIKKTRNSLLTLTEMHIKALRGLVESQKGKYPSINLLVIMIFVWF